MKITSTYVKIDWLGCFFAFEDEQIVLNEETNCLEHITQKRADIMQIPTKSLQRGHTI